MPLPREIGMYRIIKANELTDEQRLLLRAAGRQLVHERLCVLIGEGKISVSQVQARYGALMAEVGRC